MRREIDLAELSPRDRHFIFDMHRATLEFERQIGRLPDQDEFERMAAVIARMHGYPEHQIPPHLRHH